jgi:PAS domain S-box-containing protein
MSAMTLKSGIRAGWLYVAAVVCAGLGVWAGWGIGPWVVWETPYLTVIPAVMLAAFFLGPGPGLAGALAGAVLTEVFLVEPFGKFAMHGAVLLRGSVVLFSTVFLGWAGQALRRQQALLDAISAATEDAIFVKDRQGRMLLANPATVRAIGKPAGRILGHRDDEFYDDPAVSATILETDRRIMESGRTEAVEEIIPTPEGNRTFLSIKARWQDRGGRVMGLVGVARDITERKRAEEALKESEIRFRSLFESMLNGFAHCRMLVENGRPIDFVYLDVNSAFERLTGLKNVVGRRATAVIPGLVEANPELLEIYGRVASTGESAQFEQYVAPLAMWFSISVYCPAEGHFVAVFDVITDRKRAEAALRQSEQRFKILSGATFEGIIISEAGRMVDVNEQLERMFGYEPGEMIGLGLEVLLPVEVRPRILDNIRKGIDANTEHRCLRKDGTLFDIEAHGRTLEIAGRPVRITTIRDVTERKRAAEELRHANEAAETASRAKDHFLAVLSHELRTPLTPVLAAAGMLEKDQRLPEDARRDMMMMRRNVEMETRLIDDLLDITRITRGKLAMEMRPVRLCDIVRYAVDVCAADVKAKGLELTLDLGKAPCTVRGDGARLQQVFWNLLKNAVKFTPPGGKIAVACRRAGPDATGTEEACVDITDTGIGITPEQLPKLFCAFEQGGESVTRLFGGLGLGLAISKTIVALHGGQITARSAGPSQGAVFTVELPVLRYHRPDEPETRPADARTEPSARKLKILLVEDHPDTARILQRLLETSGHEVHTADSVRAGMDLGVQGIFDLLVSDLGLPDGSGLDLMRHLQREQPGLPGIAVSGFGMEGDIQRSREAGFAAHLVKPLDFTLLEAAMARVAGKA